MTEAPENEDEIVLEEPSPFGEWLKGQHAAKKWTQQDLADKAGITQAAISNLEQGKSRNPQSATRERLAQALGVKVPAHVKKQAKEEAEVEGIGEIIDFDPYDDVSLPRVPGVYVFYDITDRPVYVGLAVKGDRTIRTRVREHDEKFWFKRPVVNHASYIKIGC